MGERFINILKVWRDMAQIKKKYGFFTGLFFAMCSGLVLLPAVDGAVALAGDNKVGIIDTGRIVLQSQYGQRIKTEFTAEMEEQRKALDKKRDAAEKQRQRLISAKEAGKGASVIAKQEKEFEKTIRELKWMKEDFDKELLEMDKAMLEKMKERVRLVLEQFVATTDYCIIMEKQRVAVFCESADVTDQIIKRLDSYRE